MSISEACLLVANVHMVNEHIFANSPDRTLNRCNICVVLWQFCLNENLSSSFLTNRTFSKVHSLCFNYPE